MSKIKPDAVLLIESNSDLNEMLVKYHGNADEFNSTFHFSLREKLLDSIKNSYRSARLLDNLYGVEHNLPSYKIENSQQSNQDAIFLSNHDGFAGDRVATQLGGNVAKIKAVASLYLLLSGTPVIYYG